MFDYEYLAGKAFIKDKRLKSYDWTDTGIMLWIPNIDNKNDLGKYQGDVATEEQNSQNVIAITKIFGKIFLSLFFTIIRMKCKYNLGSRYSIRNCD